MTTSLPDTAPAPAPSTASASASAPLSGLLRQSAALFVANMFTIVAGYGFKIYLARSLGSVAIGAFALGESVVSFAVLAVVLELQTGLVRFVPMFRGRKELDRLRRLIWASWWQVCILGTVGAVGFVLLRRPLAGLLLKDRGLAIVITFVGVSLPLRCAAMVARHTSRGYKEVLRVVVIDTLVLFGVKAVVTVTLISMGYGFAGWLAGECAGYLAVTCGYAALALHLSPAPVRRPQFVVRHEPEVYAFLGSMLGLAALGIANVRLGTIVIGVTLSARLVGIYSLAVTGVSMMAMVQSTLNGVAAPNFAELAAKGERGKIQQMFFRITRWNLMGTIPLMAIFVILADPMMAVFGPEFRQGAPALAILAAGQAINLGTGPCGTLLNMTGGEQTVLRLQIVQFVLNIGLMFALLPWLGLTGAALAASVAVGVFYVILYRRAKQAWGLVIYDRRAASLAIATVLLAGLTWGLGWLIGGQRPVVALIVALATLYPIWVAALWAWIMDDEDRRFFREAIHGALVRLGVGSKGAAA